MKLGIEHDVKKHLLLVSTMLLVLSLGASALELDVESSSSREASVTSDVAKTVELDATISNTGGQDATVTVMSAVCGPDSFFRVTDSGSGCAENSTGVVSGFGLAKGWVSCGGSSKANICSEKEVIPADSSVDLDTVSIDVPVDSEDGVYDAGMVVRESQLGTVKKESRSITVGSTGFIDGFVSWVGNLLGNLF